MAWHCLRKLAVLGYNTNLHFQGFFSKFFFSNFFVFFFSSVQVFSCHRHHLAQGALSSLSKLKFFSQSGGCVVQAGNLLASFPSHTHRQTQYTHFFFLSVAGSLVIQPHKFRKKVGLKPSQSGVG